MEPAIKEEIVLSLEVRGAEVWGVEEDPKGVPGSQGRMGGVLRLRGGTQGGVEAIKGHGMVVSPL